MLNKLNYACRDLHPLSLMLCHEIIASKQNNTFNWTDNNSVSMQLLDMSGNKLAAANSIQPLLELPSLQLVMLLNSPLAASYAAFTKAFSNVSQTVLGPPSSMSNAVLKIETGEASTKLFCISF